MVKNKPNNSMDERNESLAQQVHSSFVKTINSQEFKDLLKESGYGCRLRIFANEKEIFGTSISKAPETPEELIELLQHLVDFLKAPDVADPEVLGKYGYTSDNLIL